MSSTRLIVLVVLFSSCGAFTLAQATRVVVVKPGDDELRRTAYRLRLCPEQLQNARQALAAALALAPEVAGDTWLGDLGYFVIRLEPERAPEILTRLLSQLAEEAGKSEDSQATQQIMSSAQQLLLTLREKDADAAQEVIRNWPEPPSDGPQKRFLEQMRTILLGQQIQSLGRSDPVKAMQQLPELEKGHLDLQTRSDLLQQLAGTGAQEEARRLLDESMAATLQTGLDSGSLYSFGQIVAATAYALPDRLPNVISQLETVLGGLPDTPNAQTYVGDKQIPLSDRENLVLSIARSLGNRPDTVNKIVDMVPGLRQKLEPFGGIDGVLSPPAPPVPAGARRRMNFELKGGTISEASLTELEARGPTMQDIVDLTQAAMPLCDRDPDQATTLLERAAEMVAKAKDVETSDAFQQFVLNSCVECRGSLTPTIVELGEELLARLRRGESQADGTANAQGAAPGINSFSRERADYLEARLISAQAVGDFSTAMDRAGALAQPRVRFLTYIQIAQLIAR